MTDMTLEQEILEVVRRLNTQQQREALEYLRDLEQPKGEPGWLFIERTRDIHIEPDDLKAMADAIEEDCERVNAR